MDHEESRKRVCALCIHRISRREIRARPPISLSQNKKYRELLSSILPGYDVDNFQHPTVICGCCARELRRKDNGKKGDNYNKNLELAHDFLGNSRRRSPRKISLDHRDCRICDIANSGEQGACPLPESSAHPPTRKRSASLISKDTPEPAYISNKDVKQIQTEWNLPQRVILGVTKAFRYATHGALEVENGLKEFLAEENKIFEDIFDVSFFMKTLNLFQNSRNDV